MTAFAVYSEAAAMPLDPLTTAAAAAEATINGLPISFLTHELTQAHVLMMQVAARADRALDRAEREDAAGGRASWEAVRLAHVCARPMDRYRVGLETLRGMRAEVPPGTLSGSPPGTRDRTPVGAAAEQGQRRSPGPVAAATHGTGLGRLRNGNPAGDFRGAPRCGARTRAGGACRQPAMTNGRCRMHGGRSTGPRTAAGLARSRQARYVHGWRTGELRALRSAAAHSARRLATLIRAARRSPAWHGLHRSVSPGDVFPTQAGTQGPACPDSARTPSARADAIMGFGLRPDGRRGRRPAWHGLHRPVRAPPRQSAGRAARRASWHPGGPDP